MTVTQLGSPLRKLVEVGKENCRAEIEIMVEQGVFRPRSESLGPEDCMLGPAGELSNTREASPDVAGVSGCLLGLKSSA